MDLTGVDCERCGYEITLDHGSFQLKENGDRHDLCGKCAVEVKKKEWDKKNLNSD